MSEAVAERRTLGASAHGKLAELAAIEALVSKGHKIAVPVVDDDGVDLVVDYHITVQVKNSARRLMETKPGHSYAAHTWRSNRSWAEADVFMLYGGGDWWIVPRSALLGSSSQINFYFNSRRGISYELRQYKDAWHVFNN